MEAFAITIFNTLIKEGILEVSAVVLMGMAYIIYLLVKNQKSLEKLETDITEDLGDIKEETIKTNAILSILGLQTNRSVK